MKKAICFSPAFAMPPGMYACGSEPMSASTPTPEASAPPLSVAPEATPEPESGDDTDIGDFELYNGLFNVTITVPAGFIDEG